MITVVTVVLMQEKRGKEKIKSRPPCICQTLRGAISLVLSTRCFLSSFSCSFNSGYRVLERGEENEREEERER